MRSLTRYMGWLHEFAKMLQIMASLDSQLLVRMKLLNYRLIFLLGVLLHISEGLKTKPNKQKPKGKPKPGKVPGKVPGIKPIPVRYKDGLIQLRVLQVSESGLSRRSEVEVVIPENGEVIVGQDTDTVIGDPGGKLILQCVAPFPVQWLYSGDGNPEIITNLTVSTGSLAKEGKIYTTNAGLGYNGPISDTDTGEYICKRVQTMGSNWQNYTPQYASFYIYVPGDSLFVQKTGEILHPPTDAHWIRLPCSVTHPGVVVTLQKNDNGLFQCPSGHEVRFNAKSGFIVTSQTSLEGRYVCIGSLSDGSKNRSEIIRAGSRMQLVEYEVRAEEEGKKKKSKGSKKKVSGRTTFAIFDNNSEDDDNSGSFEEYAFRRNEEKVMSQSSCHPNPCGSNSVCKTFPGKAHLPRCSCRVGYIGRPPKCRPECSLDIDCPFEMSCQERRCTNPCGPNQCGQGARCEVVNHLAKCSCPPGYRGNPERHGKCGRKRGPILQYFPSIVQEIMESSGMMENEGPFVEFGSISSSEEELVLGENQGYEKQQGRYPCEPWPCGPNSQCRPVGEDAHCTCSKGYVGRPPNCRPECASDRNCPNHLACIETRCRDPCVFTEGKCGYRAECRTMDHIASCFCPGGTYGDPFVKCRLQQPGHGQGQGQNQGQVSYPPQNQVQGQVSYPPQNPFPESPNTAPFVPQMRPQRPQMRPNRPGASRPPPNPCQDSPCGKYALCSSRNDTIGCKCPPNLSGFGSDPYVECYPSNNACESCGPFSKCVVDSGRPAFCSCLEGKVGSPPNCRDGFCQQNRDCDDDQSCQEGRCDSPCRMGSCGRNAVCRAMRHRAVCACRGAPDRDPLYGCHSQFQEEYRSGGLEEEE